MSVMLLQFLIAPALMTLVYVTGTFVTGLESCANDVTEAMQPAWCIKMTSQATFSIPGNINSKE